MAEPPPPPEGEAEYLLALPGSAWHIALDSSAGHWKLCNSFSREVVSLEDTTCDVECELCIDEASGLPFVCIGDDDDLTIWAHERVRYQIYTKGTEYYVRDARDLTGTFKPLHSMIVKRGHFTWNLALDAEVAIDREMRVVVFDRPTSGHRCILSLPDFVGGMSLVAAESSVSKFINRHIGTWESYIGRLGLPQIFVHSKPWRASDRVQDALEAMQRVHGFHGCCMVGVVYLCLRWAFLPRPSGGLQDPGDRDRALLFFRTFAALLPEVWSPIMAIGEVIYHPSGIVTAPLSVAVRVELRDGNYVLHLGPLKDMVFQDLGAQLDESQVDALSRAHRLRALLESMADEVDLSTFAHLLMESLCNVCIGVMVLLCWQWGLILDERLTQWSIDVVQGEASEDCPLSAVDPSSMTAASMGEMLATRQHAFRLHAAKHLQTPSVAVDHARCGSRNRLFGTVVLPDNIAEIAPPQVQSIQPENNPRIVP